MHIQTSSAGHQLRRSYRAVKLTLHTELRRFFTDFSSSGMNLGLHTNRTRIKRHHRVPGTNSADSPVGGARQ